MRQVERASTNQEIIQKNSKTFFWASLFFSKTQRIDAWRLYSWCRYVDDSIDSAKTASEAQQNLETVRDLTKRALLGEENLACPFAELAKLKKAHRFPDKWALDLVRGLAMDAQGFRPQDESELKDYCYCVAGTVGLIMCPIMGFQGNITANVENDPALTAALKLGEAMQLTNISRDLWEDHKMNRCYVPLSWLNENGLNFETLWNDDNKSSLLNLRQRILVMAENSYKLGFSGLVYLPLRAALAVVIAGFLYRAIGRKALHLEEKSLKERTVIGVPHKVGITISALLYFIGVVWKKLMIRVFRS